MHACPHYKFIVCCLVSLARIILTRRWRTLTSSIHLLIISRLRQNCSRLRGKTWGHKAASEVGGARRVRLRTWSRFVEDANRSETRNKQMATPPLLLLLNPSHAVEVDWANKERIYKSMRRKTNTYIHIFIHVHIYIPVYTHIYIYIVSSVNSAHIKFRTGTFDFSPPAKFQIPQL